MNSSQLNISEEKMRLSSSPFCRTHVYLSSRDASRQSRSRFVGECGLSQARCSSRRSRLTMNAGLPDGNTLAVLQQGSAFAILVVAEGFYTRTQMSEDTPGRPSILPIFAGVTGLVAALALLKLEQGEQLGLIVGGVVSGLLLLLNIKRSFDTEADPSEWPGPKAWPIFVSTGAFFSMLAFLESFQYLS